MLDNNNGDQEMFGTKICGHQKCGDQSLWHAEMERSICAMGWRGPPLAYAILQYLSQNG